MSLTRKLDLRKLRQTHNVTQQRLAELTDYPQSFISQMECGRVSVPDQFMKKLEEVLGIKDFEPFLVSEIQELPESVAEEISEDKKTIARLLSMIERRDEQISQLVSENTRLTQELFNIYNPKPKIELIQSCEL